MAKRFKLKFNIPSFQICRSKNLSSFPENPVPAIYRLSPVNPKAHDVGYPNPSSPSPSKITSIARGCQMCRDKEKKVKVRGSKSTSRRSDFITDIVNDEESETLISCLTSFSDEFCEEKDLSSRHRRKITSTKKVQRVRFQGLENRREEETTQVKKKKTVTSRASFSRNRVEGKVKESFAVVKKSKDPYDDFRKSMMEMITEMEMSEAAELEQLLQCFLALNSRSYHAVIVRAFMEIWQQMFVLNPATSIKNLQTHVQTDLQK